MTPATAAPAALTVLVAVALAASLAACFILAALAEAGVFDRKASPALSPRARRALDRREGRSPRTRAARRARVLATLDR